MTNEIQSIAIDKFVPHPDNPNRMTKANFAKLVRNIERMGRYEPLVVQPCPGRTGCFQIINGHHRWQALAQLGYKTADVVVWNINDAQVNILLATLNRLGGSDVLEKKLALLRRLSSQMQTKELAKLLPQTARQIERLTNLKMPTVPAKVEAKCFANPLVFFVSDKQQQVIEKALAMADQNINEPTRAAKKAAALTKIAEVYLAQNLGDSI